MYSNINATAFTYISNGTTAQTITTTSRIHRGIVDTYLEEVYPIVSKTNTSFTYLHPNVNLTTTSLTGTTVAGNTTITGATVTNEYQVGRTIERTGGSAMPNGTITNIINATSFTVSNSPTASGPITYLINGDVNTILNETPGEVVRNSDGTMRVYFRSGWIG
jgi:hypothetical protein